MPEAFASLEDTFAVRLEELFKTNDTDQPVAVGVSGGSDSVALSLLLAKALGPGRVIAFSVDHGLRHGSAAEARWTQKQLLMRGVQCAVLTVQPGDMPAGNTQASARTARYRLMANACERRQCRILCTAHTLDDQAETVLARLARGSGTKGLSGIAALSAYPIEGLSGQLRLARPALHLRRETLRDYLRSIGQRWAQDPSNTDPRYDRIRIRAMLSAWEEAGFKAERIASSAENIRRSEAALEGYTAQEMAIVVDDCGDHGASIDREAFLRTPDDIQLRVFMRALQRASGNPAQPRMAKLEHAIRLIKDGTAKRFTLHGCIIDVREQCVKLECEHAAKQGK